MATLNEAQRKALLDRGYKTSAFEKLDQAKLDSIVTPEGIFIDARTGKPAEPVGQKPVTPAPAPKAAAPVAPAPAPLPAPISAPRVPVPATTVTAPAQPLTPASVPTKPTFAFPKGEDIDVGRTVPNLKGDNLTELANKYVASRSKDPYGKVDAELERKARAKAENILGTKFTPGGEGTPLTSLFMSEAAPSGSAAKDIFEALKPQRIATPTDAYVKKEAEFAASLEAIAQLQKEYDEEIASPKDAVFDKKYNADLQELKKKRDELNTSAVLTNTDFLKRRDDLLDYNNRKAIALSEGKTIPEFAANFKDASIYDKVKAATSEVLGDVVEGLFTSEDPGGTIVETPLAYALRLLSAPVSGGIALAEAAVTDKTVAEAVPERIKEGMAATGAGVDIAEAAIESAGLPKDSAAATAARALGGGAGLIIDFLLPIVPLPPIGQAGKAAILSYKTTSALEPTVSVGRKVALAAQDAAKKAAGDTGRAIPFLARYVSPEFGNDVVSSAIARFGFDSTNLQSMADLVKLSDELPKDFARLSPDDKASAIENIWQTSFKRSADETFLDFEQRMSKVGDIYDASTYKGLKRSQPDMLKRATLDAALTPEQKARIARGATLASADLSQAVIRFALSNDIDIAKILPEFTPGPEGMSVLLEEVAKRSYGKTISSEPAVLKQYLYSHAVRKLSDTLLSSKVGAAVFPNYARLTRTSFVPAESAPSIISEYSGLMAPIRDKVVAAIQDGKEAAVLSPEELRGLIDLIAPTSLRALPKEITEGLEGILDDVLISKGPRGEVFITPGSYNVIAEKVLDAVASSKPGYKNVFDVSGDMTKLPQSEVFKRKSYLNNVLTPKEVAGGTLEVVLKSGVSKALDNGQGSYSDVLSMEFSEAIGQKWGSIPEDFKSKYRNARAEGLTAPEAWSKVMVENYIVEATRTLDELSAEVAVTTRLEAPGVPVSEAQIGQAVRFNEFAAEIKMANYEQMFDDYLSMMYGGFESMVDAINSTGRTQFLDKMLVAPFEMRKLIFVMQQHPFLKSLKAEFVKLVLEGKHPEALIKLRDAHAIVQGRGINAFIKSKEELETLFSQAKRFDTNGVLDGLPYESELFQQGTRGLFEIYNYAKESAPMFFVDDHIKLLSAQYLTRRQAGIVSEIYRSWSEVMPDLLPTGKGIQDIADNFVSQVAEYFFRADVPLYAEVKKAADSASKDATMSYKVAEEVAPAERTILQTALGEADAAKIEQIVQETEVAGGIREATTAPPIPISISRSPSEFIESLDISIDEILEGYIRGSIAKIPGFAEESVETAKDIFIALVEDNLTLLSSSEAAARRYPKTVNKLELVKEVYNDLLAKAKAKGIELDRANKKALLTYIRGLHSELFFKTGRPYIASFAGSSDYISSIYPALRQETTPLFFDTLKTAIRQAARSNLDVVSRGPLEQVVTLPLTFEETGRIKGQLLARGGIEEYTKTMEDMAIGSPFRKLDPETAANLSEDIDTAIEVGLAATEGLRAASNAGKGYAANRYFQVIGEFIGSKESLFTDGTLSKIAKGGVLGGNLLPNFRYLMTNFLTAPAIIYGSIGGAFDLNIFNNSVMSSMKALVGSSGVLDIPAATIPATRFTPEIPVTPAIPISSVAALADVRELDIVGLPSFTKTGAITKPPKVEVVVTSASGKVYTNYDIARIVGSNSIARSQASAELTSKVVQDIVSFSRIEQAALTSTDVPKGLASMETGTVKALLNDALGLSGRGMNVYQEIGGMTDTMFRTNVLIKALREGRSEADAIRLAREALFDYGNLSSIEKKYISKLFWFWAFRRNAYRQVGKSFLTNPARIKNAYIANGYFPEIDREYNIATKDYAATRPFIYLVNDKANKQRYGLYGPSIPQLDATAQLIDYLSIGLPLFNSKYTLGEAVIATTRNIAEKTGEMASPAPQTAIGLYLGVDIRREGQQLGYGIDPRLMAYITSNDEIFATFTSLINVEVVPPEEEIPGRGTYKGRQWRIKKGDTGSVRNWFAIQQAMLGIGIQRNLRDYAAYGAPATGFITEAPIKTGEPAPERAQLPDVVPIQLGGMTELSSLQNFLYTAGVVTPIDQPSLEDVIQFNKRALAQEFREGTYK